MSRRFPFLVQFAFWFSITAAPVLESHAAGGPGSALSFDGNDDRVQTITNTFSAIANSFTIEMWVKPTGFRTPTAEVNAGISDINQRFAVFPDHGDLSYGANRSAVGLSVGTNGISVFEHAVNYLPSLLVYPVALSNWTHVALVYVNRQPHLYVNGSLVRSGLTSTKTFVHPSANLGGSINAIGFGPFQGQIDEVRIWSVAQSATQLQTNRNRSLTGSEANLVVYYRCDEGGGNSLADSAAASPSNNGTLVNGTAWVPSAIQPFSPFVETLPASVTGTIKDTLNGIANPVGTNTIAWFEWGTTTNYGNLTPLRALGSGTANTNWNEVLVGVSMSVTYHFRAVASNSLGVAFGTNQTFTTQIFSLAISNLTFFLEDYSAAWGDYDNDGRLDLVLHGMEGGLGTHVTEVWRNTGNGFSNILNLLPGYELVPIAWGDADSDNRLDVLMLPWLFRNTGTGFSATNLGLPPALRLRWVAYDNDGRLDVLAVDYFSGVIAIYQNGGGGFVLATNITLPGIPSSLDWGDYDNDGRGDILVTVGTGTSGPYFTQVWRNTGSGFTNIHAGLPGLVGAAAWGDYDNDGRLDIVLAGRTNGLPSGAVAQVWRNTGNGFTNINAGLPGFFGISFVAWGDYDNDGRLDILLAGTTNYVSGTVTESTTQIWRNTGSGFSQINVGLPGIIDGTVAWGDYDNDGRLDLLLSGPTRIETNGVTYSGFISQVWRNNTPITNTPPVPPTGLSVSAIGNHLYFSWNAASDAQTPAAALTYNLRVGTTPGGSDLMSPQSLNTGRRLLPAHGNAHRMTTAVLRNLPLGNIYWSVQTVDNGFVGSTFSSESSFALHGAMGPAGSATFTPGDVNGDGMVSQAELNGVLANYWTYSPWLYLTNVAGLGGTNVTFALENSTAGAFSVEYTTNLTDWFFLGPATPRYLFTDTNAPAVPQRFYRLRWP